MDSPGSTYVLSLSDASVSDLGSPVSSPTLVAANPEPKSGAPPECEEVPLFEPGDGDTYLSANGTRFETHKYLIKRFLGLKILLDKQPLEISIQRDDISADDFCEMFKVLYSSVITGPSMFASHTLVSALRVATAYKYPALRDFCVQHLETLKLDAVKRIEIAREFNISAWEQPAYRDLGMRDEPITREEAKIIGLDAFVHIAEMREKEQRRRGKEIDATGRKYTGLPSKPESGASVGGVLQQVQNGSTGHGPQAGTDFATSPCTSQRFGNTWGTNETTTRAGNSGAVVGPLESLVKKPDITTTDEPIALTKSGWRKRGAVWNAQRNTQLLKAAITPAQRGSSQSSQLTFVHPSGSAITVPPSHVGSSP